MSSPRARTRLVSSRYAPLGRPLAGRQLSALRTRQRSKQPLHNLPEQLARGADAVVERGRHLENLEARLDRAHDVDRIDPSAVRSTAATYALSQAIARAERVGAAAAAYLELASVAPDKEVVAAPSEEKVPTRAATDRVRAPGPFEVIGATAPVEIVLARAAEARVRAGAADQDVIARAAHTEHSSRSEEHTSELQSRGH